MKKSRPADKVHRLQRKRAVQALVNDKNGNLLAAELEGRTISLVNLTRDKVIHQIKIAKDDLVWTDFTPDACRLVFITSTSEVYVFDLAEGKITLPVLKIPEKHRFKMLRGDAKAMVLFREPTMREGGQLVLWNLEESKLIAPLYWARVGTIAFSPNGDLIAAGGAAGGPNAVRFWDAEDGRRALDFYSGHPDNVYCVAFSPDGKEAATCSGTGHDPYVRFWDTTTGKAERKLDGGTPGLHRLAYTPDGRFLAAGGLWNGSTDVAIWDASNLKNIRNLKGHVWGAQLISVSSDGKFLASVGGATTPDDVIIWDLDTGKSLARHKDLGRSSQHVAFLPDGRTLILCNYENIRIWNWQTNRALVVRHVQLRHGIVP